jgi:hypothetical protein
MTLISQGFTGCKHMLNPRFGLGRGSQFNKSFSL